MVNFIHGYLHDCDAHCDDSTRLLCLNRSSSLAQQVSKVQLQQTSRLRLSNNSSTNLDSANLKVCYRYLLMHTETFALEMVFKIETVNPQMKLTIRSKILIVVIKLFIDFKAIKERSMKFAKRE
jgi:hypothetical protein